LFQSDTKLLQSAGPATARLDTLRSVRCLTALVTAVLLAATVAGCGTNETSAVKAKVTQFANAVASHDYETICTQVLAPQLLADVAAGGIGCEHAMRIALSSVHDARLTVGAVTVDGNRASVLTVAEALREKALLTKVELIDTANGWRISSLGNPVG
jgi:hypothetical protein